MHSKLLITSGKDLGDYVAKRFFKLSQDDTSSPNSFIEDYGEHRSMTIQEAIRISQGTWILKEFFKHAENFPNIAVDNALRFASVFLAEETGEGVPSPASHVLEPNIKPLWIVESWRAKAVTKFTGTLNHSSVRADSLSQTVHAFAHFSYLFTKGEMVFADLQGTPAFNNGESVTILFDVMTHTLHGDSGIGDHGEEGIQSFLETHTCGEICAGLDIKGRVAKENDDDEDDDEDTLDRKGKGKADKQLTEKVEGKFSDDEEDIDQLAKDHD
ncbi:kinase-like domain-containing protein [Crepidotus variabilis]|uniref:Kinase-like domain-containing protein n=1 Tax=Crepidotus variabilis TaxID=179855 RepID=A0A9P6E5A1_9AGAR|nr:kinase-like domain-containing protein [Crepidotus variabilis]